MHRTIAPLALLVASAALCGCGPITYEAPGTARVVGADATIELEEIEGGTALVELEIRHLPPAARVKQGMTTYVAWFVPPDQPPQKASVLDYDEDDRVGRMLATSPERTFEVRVTAESKPGVAAPSSVTIISKKVSLDQ